MWKTIKSVFIGALLLLSGGSSLAAAQDNNTQRVVLTGNVQVLVGHKRPTLYNIKHTHPELIYQLVDRQGVRDINLRIDLGDQAEDYVTGDIVQVPILLPTSINTTTTSRSFPFPTTNTINLGSIPQGITNLTADGNITYIGYNGKRDFVIGDKPVNHTSITVYFQGSCRGQRLAMQDLNKYWYNDPANPRQITLQRSFETCSYNKLLFPPSQNIIVGPVPMPCQGTTVKGPYNTETQCTDAEIYGEWEVALDWISKNRPDIFKNIRSYKRKILLAAHLVECDKQWSGLGSVGCGSGHCLTWINMPYGGTGSPTFDVSTIFHELGHNIGLQHSSRFYTDGQKGEYDDPTDVLGMGGFATGLLCMTAPQAFKAGWANVVPGNGRLNFTEMAPFLSYTYDLPSMGANHTSIVRVVFDRLSMFMERSIVVSYRATVVAKDVGAAGYDSGLNKDFNMKVYVHAYNGTNNARPDPNEVDPMILGVLDVIPRVIRSGRIPMNVGPQFVFDSGMKVPNGRLRVRVISTNTSHARVSLCRFADAETACTDGGGASLPSLSPPPPPPPQPPKVSLPPPPPPPPPKPLRPKRVSHPPLPPKPLRPKRTPPV